MFVGMVGREEGEIKDGLNDHLRILSIYSAVEEWERKIPFRQKWWPSRMTRGERWSFPPSPNWQFSAKQMQLYCLTTFLHNGHAWCSELARTQQPIIQWATSRHGTENLQGNYLMYIAPQFLHPFWLHVWCVSKGPCCFAVKQFGCELILCGRKTKQIFLRWKSWVLSEHAIYTFTILTTIHHENIHIYNSHASGSIHALYIVHNSPIYDECQTQ